jgi:hypothetical protein
MKKVRLIGILAAVLVMVVSGCTSTTPSKPAPNNPTGTLLDPATAAYFAKDYAYRLYEGSNTIIPFNVTLKAAGSPAAWNGTEAGNCTTWFLYLEGVMYDIGTYRYIKLAMQETYRDGQVYSQHSVLKKDVIEQADLNATLRSIQAVSIERYLVNASSHELLLKADAAKYEMPSGHYLQSISISLMHNTTSTISGTAIWQVSWKYIDNGNGKSAYARVSMDAASGAVIKVEGPK